MTKRKRLSLLSLLAFSLILSLFFYFFTRSKNDLTKQSITSSQKLNLEKQDQEQIMIDGRKIIGPDYSEEEIKSLKVANKATSFWRESLERTLRKQGGKAIKDIKFDVVESLVWTENNRALYVESVLVTLKDDKNVQTNFKVMVDSQTGKILKNWDQPVIDPANPREDFKLKLDPRYHSDH
jgi:hypothetical protein